MARVITVNERLKLCQREAGPEKVCIEAAHTADPLEQLVLAHQEDVTRLVYRMLGWNGQADVDDVVQDVFVSAISKLKQFEGRNDIKTWLMRIAINQCRDHFRKQQRFGDTIKRLFLMRGNHCDETVETAEMKMSISEEADQVRRTVLELPVKLREVSVLRYLEEMPVKTIADVLDIQPNAVEVRLHRARKILNKRLEEFITHG